MFRAQQEQVVQEANIGIIEIRGKEVDFYSRVNATLGTQAALIGGFAYLTFSQNIDARYDYVYYCGILYWIFAGMTIVFAIHVILTTMLVQLLGPGLALNGPVGSMARAAEGMRVEQQSIVRTFFTMMFFFTASTVLLFWVTMEMVSACVCSAGFLVCVNQWIYQCSRIYYRFHWDREKMANQTGRWRSSEHDEPVLPVTLQATAARNPVHEMDVDMGGDDDRESLASQRPSLMERMVGSLPRLSLREPRSSLSAPTAPSMATASAPQIVNPKATAAEGFLVMNPTIKDPKLAIKQWERRYVVMNYRGQLSYYKTRQDFRRDPGQTLNPRPLSLDDFFVVPEAVDGNGRSVAFALARRDDGAKCWVFRTDTEEELEMWVAALEQVSPSSFDHV